jgi:hypothetical protein
MFFCLDPAAGPQVLPPGSVLPPGAVPMLQPPPVPDAEMADVYRKPPTKKKKATQQQQPVYYQAPQPAQTRGTSKAAALSTKRRWSKHEDEKLCAAVKAVGLGDWKTIATVYMRGHDLSDAQCMHRWQKVLRPGLVKGAFCEKEDKVIVDCLREGGLKRRWTKQEDEKLCLAVKAVGTHDWKRIAEQHLAGHGRSDVQCLHRWQKVLRAGLVKGAFTEEEDKIIIQCMNEGGTISASRRVVVPSLLQYDSCPSHDDVGCFFFEFEAIRTASSEYDAPRRSHVDADRREDSGTHRQTMSGTVDESSRP